MAKATFQRNQKVWVQAVGAWAIIERVVPTWARGFDEPVRVTYDVGLGRVFLANELRREDECLEEGSGADWRLRRVRNKWQAMEDCGRHPHPGSFPVVTTDPEGWGGWRVSAAEYDRTPLKIEYQARLIASAPAYRHIANELLKLIGRVPSKFAGKIESLSEATLALEQYVLNKPPQTPSSVTGCPSN